MLAASSCSAILAPVKCQRKDCKNLSTLSDKFQNGGVCYMQKER